MELKPNFRLTNFKGKNLNCKALKYLAFLALLPSTMSTIYAEKATDTATYLITRLGVSMLNTATDALFQFPNVSNTFTLQVAGDTTSIDVTSLGPILGIDDSYWAMDIDLSLGAAKKISKKIELQTGIRLSYNPFSLDLTKNTTKTSEFSGAADTALTSSLAKLTPAQQEQLEEAQASKDYSWTKANAVVAEGKEGAVIYNSFYNKGQNTEAFTVTDGVINEKDLRAYGFDFLKINAPKPLNYKFTGQQLNTNIEKSINSAAAAKNASLAASLASNLGSAVNVAVTDTSKISNALTADIANSKLNPFVYYKSGVVEGSTSTDLSSTFIDPTTLLADSSGTTKLSAGTSINNGLTSPNAARFVKAIANFATVNKLNFLDANHQIIDLSKITPLYTNAAGNIVVGPQYMILNYDANNIDMTNLNYKDTALANQAMAAYLGTPNPITMLNSRIGVEGVVNNQSGIVFNVTNIGFNADASKNTFYTNGTNLNANAALGIGGILNTQNIGTVTIPNAPVANSVAPNFSSATSNNTIYMVSAVPSSDSSAAPNAVQNPTTNPNAINPSAVEFSALDATAISAYLGKGSAQNGIPFKDAYSALSYQGTNGVALTPSLYNYTIDLAPNVEEKNCVVTTEATWAMKYKATAFANLAFDLAKVGKTKLGVYVGANAGIGGAALNIKRSITNSFSDKDYSGTSSFPSNIVTSLSNNPIDLTYQNFTVDEMRPNISIVMQDQNALPDDMKAGIVLTHSRFSTPNTVVDNVTNAKTFILPVGGLEAGVTFNFGSVSLSLFGKYDMAYANKNTLKTVETTLDSNPTNTNATYKYDPIKVNASSLNQYGGGLALTFAVA